MVEGICFKITPFAVLFKKLFYENSYSRDRSPNLELQDRGLDFVPRLVKKKPPPRNPVPVSSFMPESN